MLAPDARTATTELSTGTVLIQEGLLLPESLDIETSAYSHGWRVVSTASRTLDARIVAAHWNFFFTVGKLEGSALGRLKPMNLRTALRRILRQVQELNFNAVEIVG